MKKYKVINIPLVITLITLIGLGIRVVCCFWGYPYRLHPDEPAVVENVIDMINRRSWEANVYNRPDQFEIKCCALLFQFFSRIWYHMPPVEAYEKHQIAFYIVARLYTAVMGTIMIPVSAILTKELFARISISFQKIQILTALFIAFSPTLALHSSYATPDMPLSLLIMSFSIFFLRYIKRGQLKDMLLCALFTGLAITTKYTGAILCIFIAIMVIYRALKEHRTINIIKYGIVSIILVMGTMFFMAPNLFTNISTTIETLHVEARSEHLGSDGLGMLGNLLFYLKVMLQNTGILAIIPCIIAIWQIIKKPHIEYLVLLIGATWWICMSVLSLHWIRWSIPAYCFYFILLAMGIETLQQQLSRYKCVIYLLAIFILLNMIFLNAAQIKNILVSDSRIVAEEYCKQNGITKEESLSEGYSPFEKPSPFSVWRKFTVDGSRLQLLDDDSSSYKYLIIGSHYWDLYAAEPEKYADALRVYQNFDNNYKLIYHLQADNMYQGNETNRKFSIYGMRNIIDSVKYLFRSVHATGYDIYIYDMTK